MCNSAQHKQRRLMALILGLPWFLKENVFVKDVLAKAHHSQRIASNKAHKGRDCRNSRDCTHNEHVFHREYVHDKYTARKMHVVTATTTTMPASLPTRAQLTAEYEFAAFNGHKTKAQQLLIKLRLGEYS